MLTAIVAFAIRFRGVILALAALLALYGVYALSRASYDVFPEFAPPQVTIQDEAPGLAPEQVELLVTQPIENAINGVPGIQQLRSTSMQGLSLVVVTFDPNTDVYRDRQVVSERLTSVAGNLPQGVAAPALNPLTSSTSILLVAGLTSGTRSLMELRTQADWTIRPRLLGVPGVAKVAIYGGETRQIQVQVRPDRLVRFGLGLQDVLNAAPRVTGLQGAGFIETANQRIILQTVGQALTPEDVARSPVTTQNGVPVPLSAVADVAAAPEPAIGAAAIMGQPGIELQVSGQYGVNTVEVTRRVEAALEELRPALAQQGIRLYTDVFRPADFIFVAIHNVRSALILGGILVMVVLFLFLFDLRTAAISATAIPLSLLAAIIVLQALGLNLNTMTLGGLAIAIGEVVDDAVIDVENIVRRLRENRRLAEPHPPWRVVLNASVEVRGAVVYATLAVILVFLPVLTLGGLAGRIFAPLGVAYIFAVLASLAVALTVTPALSMVLLARSPLPEREPPVVQLSRGRYERLLRRVELRPRPLLVTAGVLAVAALVTLPFFGASFIPELKEEHFILHMAAVPGTSLEESMRVGDRVTAVLTRLPFVRLVDQHAGRAERADDIAGPEASEFNIDLKPGAIDPDVAEAKVRQALVGFPGVTFAVNTFLSERVEETLSGYTAPVVVNLFGNDLGALDSTVTRVAGALRRVRGATEVQLQTPPGNPQLTVQLRPADVARWGFETADVLAAVRTAFEGDVVGQVYEGNRVFDLSVILDPADRGNPLEVGNLPLRNPAGTYVRLKQLADISESSGRYQIQHVGARRVQTVTCNVAGRDVGSFVAEAKRRIAAAVRLPPGTYLDFSGTAEEQARSRNQLLLHSLVAGTGIVLLLSIVTRNRRNLLLVLANLPFALIGGVIAVFATGGDLSVGSMVGFVTLFGITLRNSIMMISHFEHLVEVEGHPWGLETAIRGATDRLAPILMTSLVTMLGLLPLALGMDAPGREIEGPMAVVILGGLVTSLALNLLLLPTLALRFGRFEMVRES